MKALIFLVVVNVFMWAVIVMAAGALVVQAIVEDLIGERIGKMKEYLNDLLLLAVFVAIASAAYVGLSYMVTGDVVSPAQLVVGKK